MPYAGELDVPGPFTRVSGYQRTREALDVGLDFTAVFAGTDGVATGSLAALREAGLDVPGDISLVGFDDVSFAADLTPALTTVRVPYEDLGRTAVRLGLERAERLAADDHVVLSTQLVIRQSVRTLRCRGTRTPHERAVGFLPAPARVARIRMSTQVRGPACDVQSGVRARRAGASPSARR